MQFIVEYTHDNLKGFKVPSKRKNKIFEKRLLAENGLM